MDKCLLISCQDYFGKYIYFLYYKPFVGKVEMEMFIKMLISEAIKESETKISAHEVASAKNSVRLQNSELRVCALI